MDDIPSRNETLSSSCSNTSTLSYSDDTIHSACTLIQVEFNEPGDLGLGIRIKKSGKVVLKEFKPILGYAEKSNLLRKGDVLVQIDDESILTSTMKSTSTNSISCPQPNTLQTTTPSHTKNSYFKEIMSKLRQTSCSRPTRLYFLHVPTTSTPSIEIKKWKDSQLADNQLIQPPKRGEFEVVFQLSQPMGFRLSSSYLMIEIVNFHHFSMDPIQAQIVCKSSINQIIPWNKHSNLLTCLKGFILIRIDKEDVLGVPYEEVIQYLYTSQVKFPRRLTFIKSKDQIEERKEKEKENEFPNVIVLEIPTHECMNYLQFERNEIMAEVPMISALRTILPTSPNSASVKVTSPLSPNRRSFSSHSFHSKYPRPDGIELGQLITQMNGISTIGVPFSQILETLSDIQHSKHIQTHPHGTITMRFRDIDQYREEYQQGCPLSPWRRREIHEKEEMFNEQPTLWRQLSGILVQSPFHSKDQIKKTDFDFDDEKEPSSKVHFQSKVRGDYFHSHILQSVRTTSFSFPQSYWSLYQHGNFCGYHIPSSSLNDSSFSGFKAIELIIPDTKRPIGLDLETDFTHQYVIVKGFNRETSRAKRCGKFQLGDYLVSIDNQPIEEIPTDTLINIIRDSEQTRNLRKFHILRKKKASNRFKTWLKNKTSTKSNTRKKQLLNPEIELSNTN